MIYCILTSGTNGLINLRGVVFVHIEHFQVVQPYLMHKRVTNAFARGGVGLHNIDDLSNRLRLLQRRWIGACCRHEILPRRRWRQH